MLTLIENGDVYAPEHLGEQSILLVDGKVGLIGEVDRNAVEALGIDVEFIDASECLICPGFIDPHEHLLGGSGEEGFATQTPEIHLSEIVCAGITTVVGTLGVDTTMKTMAGLLAKAKALREEGLTAYLWSGGYNVPATSIMSSVREDMMFIDEVIGAGEIAIADERHRAVDPRVGEARRRHAHGREAQQEGRCDALPRRPWQAPHEVPRGDARLRAVRDRSLLAVPDACGAERGAHAGRDCSSRSATVHAAIGCRWRSFSRSSRETPPRY
jgi:hypothetical protein